MDLVRAEILCSGSLSPPLGTGGLGGPAVLGALETGLEKPHSVEDPGLYLASSSSAADDEIPPPMNGPQILQLNVCCAEQHWKTMTISSLCARLLRRFGHRPKLLDPCYRL